MLLGSIDCKKSKSLLIGVLYRPPDSSNYLSENFEILFDEMLSTAVAEGRETIIIGDTTCDFLKRNDHKNILSSYGIEQQIKDPTRITKQTSTLIDIIATTHPESVKSSIVLGSPLSDHEIVAIIRKINCQRTKPRKVVSRNFSKYSHEAFQRGLAFVSWDDILKEINVNAAWSAFKELFQKVLNKHAPIVERTVRGRDLPWLNNAIKQEIYERDYYFRKAKQTGRENL